MGSWTCASPYECLTVHVAHIDCVPSLDGNLWLCFGGKISHLQFYTSRSGCHTLTTLWSFTYVSQSCASMDMCPKVWMSYYPTVWVLHMSQINLFSVERHGIKGRVSQDNPFPVERPRYNFTYVSKGQVAQSLDVILFTTYVVLDECLTGHVSQVNLFSEYRRFITDVLVLFKRNKDFSVRDVCPCIHNERRLKTVRRLTNDPPHGRGSWATLEIKKKSLLHTRGQKIEVESTSFLYSSARGVSSPYYICI